MLEHAETGECAHCGCVPPERRGGGWVPLYYDVEAGQLASALGRTEWSGETFTCTVCGAEVVPPPLPERLAGLGRTQFEAKGE